MIVYYPDGTTIRGELLTDAERAAMRRVVTERRPAVDIVSMNGPAFRTFADRFRATAPAKRSGESAREYFDRVAELERRNEGAK